MREDWHHARHPEHRAAQRNSRDGPDGPITLSHDLFPCPQRDGWKPRNKFPRLSDPSEEHAPLQPELIRDGGMRSLRRDHHQNLPTIRGQFEPVGQARLQLEVDAFEGLVTPGSKLERVRLYPPLACDDFDPERRD